MTTGLWHSTYTPHFPESMPASRVRCLLIKKAKLVSTYTSLQLTRQLILGFSSSYTLLKRLVNYADRALKMLPARPPGGTVLIVQKFLQLGAAQLWQTESMCSLLQHNWTMSSKVSPLPAKPNKTTQLKGHKYALGLILNSRPGAFSFLGTLNLLTVDRKRQTAKFCNSGRRGLFQGTVT